MSGRCQRLHTVERGAATIAYTVIVALSMVLFVMCANAVMAVYGRGVVRGALDEGVRFGARPAAGAQVCLHRIEQVLGELLGGSMGDGVNVDCAETEEAVVATADVTFVDWMTGQPLWRFHLSAAALRESDDA